MKATHRRLMAALSGITVLLIAVAGWGQAPPTVIDNATARIVMDHTTGNITSLTYYGGSGQNIIDPYWGMGHAGLCRLNYETTTVSSWDYNGESGIQLRYQSSHGIKEIRIDWTDGVVVDIRWYLDTPYMDGWYNSWRPGGNVQDNNDKYAVEGHQGTFTYPGGWTLLWEGFTTWTALTDLDHDEVFGYKFCSPTRVRQANGASTDHYIHDLANSPNGFFAATFAVKNLLPGGDWWQAIADLDVACDGAIPVERGTWGAVKNMYR